MKHPFRSPRTSSRNTESLSAMSAAGIVAVGALLAGSSLLGGCGDSGGDGDDPGKGGSQSSAAGADGGGSGATTSVGGSQNNGGTASNSGGKASTDGGETAAGGAGDNPDPGGAGLGAADGITGTFEGKVHTHTFNAVHIPQQSKTVVIGANNAMYPLYDAWGMRFLPKLGEQACTGDTGTEDTFITFGSQTNFSQAGTTAKGACTINVTSLAPKLEGTFTATLRTDHGDIAVTDGAFRVPN